MHVIGLVRNYGQGKEVQLRAHQKVNKENISIFATMGNLLIKAGMWIQKEWCKFQCKWNATVLSLMFDVTKCPNKECKCKWNQKD